MRHGVVGVLGGSGGVGASTFAAAMAAGARPSTLIDLDALGGGVDVLLGIEGVPGARWSALRLSGGHLDPALLADGLPRWDGVAVLAADADAPTAIAAQQVVDTAAQLGPVVVDLPRAPSLLRDSVVEQCALCVVVTEGEVRGIASARAVLRSMPSGVVVGAVVRRGMLSADEVAGLLGVAVLGVLPALERSPSRPRSMARVASGVLDGMAAA
jgi:MinD-like ATPase involved in chromosome partitioning or flagellar assembly